MRNKYQLCSQYQNTFHYNGYRTKKIHAGKCDTIAYTGNWSIMMKMYETYRKVTDPAVCQKVTNVGLKRSAEDLLSHKN